MAILSKNNLKLDSLFNCLEGELNMTFHKGYMKTDKKLPLIVKGAQVQRYYLTDKPSQGVVQFVDKKKYLSDYSKSNKSNHHLQSRIALQGITGANDKIRIVSTLIDPMTFCANSCNYIICNPDNNKISLKTILVMMAKVPSEPIIKCVKLYPEEYFRVFDPVQIISPLGKTISIFNT